MYINTLKISMISFSTVVFALVLTIGKSDIYYKPAVLVQTDGYSFLEKNYGPLHFLDPIMMLMYAVIMMYFIVYAIRNRERLSFSIV